jgi:hypothetical protein
MTLRKETRKETTELMFERLVGIIEHIVDGLEGLRTIVAELERRSRAQNEDNRREKKD